MEAESKVWRYLWRQAEPQTRREHFCSMSQSSAAVRDRCLTHSDRRQSLTRLLFSNVCRGVLGSNSIIARQRHRRVTHIWCRRVPSRKAQSGEHPFAEFICGSGVRAIILYPWPKSLRMVHGAKKPANHLINEFKKYGAEFVHQRGQWQSVWTLTGLRNFYLEGLIYHEVGHHVDQYSRKCSKANRKAVESFADDYAMQRTASTTHLFDTL